MTAPIDFDPAPDPIPATAVLNLDGRHSIELFSGPEFLGDANWGKVRISLGSIYPDVKGPLAIETASLEWLTELAWTASRAIAALQGDTGTTELLDRVSKP